MNCKKCKLPLHIYVNYAETYNINIDDMNLNELTTKIKIYEIKNDIQDGLYFRNNKFIIPPNLEDKIEKKIINI